MTVENFQTVPTSGTPSNPHVWLRKLFFVACIIVFIAALLYLIYYNGKSIYDNGI